MVGSLPVTLDRSGRRGYAWPNRRGRRHGLWGRSRSLTASATTEATSGRSLRWQAPRLRGQPARPRCARARPTRPGHSTNSQKAAAPSSSGEAFARPTTAPASAGPAALPRERPPWPRACGLRRGRGAARPARLTTDAALPLANRVLAAGRRAPFVL